MHALRRDVEELNQKVLLFATESAANRELLGAAHNVGRRLAEVKPGGCRTAIKCGVPLVRFGTDAIGEIMTLGRIARSRMSGSSKPPTPLKDINVLTLQLAQKAAFVDPALAALWFALPREAEAALTDASITDLTRYAAYRASMVELRCGAVPTVWALILIGERIDGARGFRISQDAALLSLVASRV